jgi:hypothetical protein
MDRGKGPARGRKKSGRNRERDAGGPSVKIDLLEMSVKKIVFKDYSKGDPPQERPIPFSFSQAQFRNIRAKDITRSMIVLAAASHAYAGGINKFMEVLEGIGISAKKAGKKPKEVDRSGLLNKLKKALQKIGIGNDRK